MTPASLDAMRSKLFLPGTRPELFAKGAASAADALSFDLEDSVAPERKAEARANVAAALRDPALRAAGKLHIVRVNAPGTPHFADDVAALVGPGLDAINLPMVEDAAMVREAVAAIARAEAATGAAPCGILANIETPRGLRLAAEIACADPRVTGLQIGYGDLFEPFGIARDDETALHHVRLQVRMAAAEARVPAFDGALAAFASLDRCRTEAEASRRLGFAGKSCIHPSQIAVVNAAFQPSEAEIARAARVVAAAEEAEAKGIGAYTVDGQMVDAPFAASARAVLALASRLGLPTAA
ncbi:HpcH/HpaI aldolase/citrate lyase family protein [Pararoseomonas indoligenes]|uniref:CoA ester lyase n=1 Tax=Roseomonas indoligenes TaxID=2820811 RepID=A0A940MZ69_9PROT|nr:CoA ester lyase [Pararoseomonas indoligenes]MBP0494871.1 CoA ester lyase [Pararoseomonas indoligenes]